MCGAMLSKSLIQSSIDGLGSVPPLLFGLIPNNGGGSEDNGHLLLKVPCIHCCTQCPLPCTTNPCLCQRLLDTHRQVWVSLLWGHSSFFLGPGVHKILFVPSKSLFPPSCVGYGSSIVGLMALSSKGAYAIPKSAAPSHTQICCTQSPCPRGSPLLTRTSTGDAQTQFCLSLFGLPGVHKVCLSPLSISGGNGVWF